MSVVHGFKCHKCGSMLVLRVKVPPVCRVEGCGAQMRPVKARMPAKVLKASVHLFNQRHGSKPQQPEEAP